MQDKIVADGKWVFGKEVTDCFPNMLSRSIPGYDRMRELVSALAFRYVKQGTDIVDIGCSRGDAVAPFVRKFGAQNHYILIDESEEMIEVCRERYKGLINCKVVDVRCDDLVENFPFAVASVVLSVLTLQFTPLEERRNIIKKIYDALTPGGCFIFVEKVIGETPETDKLLIDEYYNLKEKNGYTKEQIEAKRKSLSGVLVPLTARQNEDMLWRAKFSHVECFWRDTNFAGWIAIK